MSATLKQFEKRFCEITKEEMGPVRHICRRLQEADLIPTGKRGMGKNAPRLTEEHAALFALAYYGTQHTKHAAAVGQRLAELKSLDSETNTQSETSKTLLEYFVDLIKTRGGEFDAGTDIDDVFTSGLYFLLLEDWPQVTIKWRKRSEVAADPGEWPQYTTLFGLGTDALVEMNPAQRTLAVEVNGDLFDVLAAALAGGEGSDD